MENLECVVIGCALKVISGKYAGLVGEVKRVTEHGAVLDFQGVFNGETISQQTFIKTAHLDFNDGKSSVVAVENQDASDDDDEGSGDGQA